MNYERIYSEFIADRIAKQPSKPDYFEKHHILPRCKGGTDGEENIICLTPEDHFFAHLLLAKSHGGKLWAPIAFMVGGSRKDYKPTHSRIAHGWASRAIAKSLSGSLAYQFDWKIYDLVHKDGLQWSGKQSEMPEGIGLTKSLANMLIKGRVSSAMGWYVSGTEPKSRAGIFHPMYKDEKHHFRHVDGREFFGTQYEFRESFGVGKAVACKLVRKIAKVWNGWYLNGTMLPTTGRGAKWAAIDIANKMRAEATSTQVA